MQAKCRCLLVLDPRIATFGPCLGERSVPAATSARSHTAVIVKYVCPAMWCGFTQRSAVTGQLLTRTTLTELLVDPFTVPGKWQSQTDLDKGVNGVCCFTGSCNRTMFAAGNVRARPVTGDQIQPQPHVAGKYLAYLDELFKPGSISHEGHKCIVAHGLQCGLVVLSGQRQCQTGATLLLSWVPALLGLQPLSASTRCVRRVTACN